MVRTVPDTQQLTHYFESTEVRVTWTSFMSVPRTLTAIAPADHSTFRTFHPSGLADHQSSHARWHPAGSTGPTAARAPSRSPSSGTSGASAAAPTAAPTAAAPTSGAAPAASIGSLILAAATAVAVATAFLA